MELGIHKNDAINANNIPSGSISKAIANPGKRSNIVIEGRAPAKTEGVMDSTSRNREAAAIKVMPSRMLGLRLANPINTAPRNGMTGAKAIAVFELMGLCPVKTGLRGEPHQRSGL